MQEPHKDLNFGWHLQLPNVTCKINCVAIRQVQIHGSDGKIPDEDNFHLKTSSLLVS
jgi:hypothetical protein